MSDPKHEGQTALAARSDLPKVGECYRHYKGGIYHVKAVGCIETTGAPFVAYQSGALGYTWMRPLDDWSARVEGQRRFIRDDSRDMPTTSVERLAWLATNCLTFSIEFNDHKSYYIPLDRYLSETPEKFRDPESSAACVAAERIFELQIYPHTPVGFCFWYGPDLDALLAIAVEQLGATSQRQR